MRRREQREHVFKLMFMTEFNSEEEMTEQLSLYFEGLGELSEQDQEYMICALRCWIISKVPGRRCTTLHA